MTLANDGEKIADKKRLRRFYINNCRLQCTYEGKYRYFTQEQRVEIECKTYFFVSVWTSSCPFLYNNALPYTYLGRAQRGIAVRPSSWDI